jgi:acyl carrier protein
MSTFVAESISRESVEPVVKRIVARALELEEDELDSSASLQLDFNAQSLDMLDISFALEREFKVPFPQTDLIQRAASTFDEEMFVQKGKVTDLGLKLLREQMPEAELSRIVPGLKAVDVVGLITVNTFTRLVTRLLEAKAEFPRECPKCGAQTEESDSMPEFVCGSCGDVRPLPSGDDILMKDMVAGMKELGLDAGIKS